MPITVSHPAAVVPLLGTPMVPSALVIGSMAPDAPLFGPVPASYATTHSLTGIVTADVALGLIAYVIWHAVLVPPAVAFAPRSLRSRLPKLMRRFSGISLDSARRLAQVAVSVAVGAATHVGWDEFTHAGRWGARHIGWLRASHDGLAGWQWTQYASDVVGAVVIAAWLARWWRSAGPRPVTSAANALASTLGAGVVLGVAVVTAAVAAAPSLSDPRGVQLHTGAYLAVTRGGAAAVLAALAVAVSWHLGRATRRDRPGRPAVAPGNVRCHGSDDT